EPPVEELVGAPRLGRLEAAGDLVLAAGAALEDGDAATDALVDRVVEAHVEVQERMLLEAAPVAAIETRRSRHVERAGDQAPFAARLDELEVLGHGLEDLLIELGVEPAATPQELVHRRAVQLVGIARDAPPVGLELLTAKGADADARA